MMVLEWLRQKLAAFNAMWCDHPVWVDRLWIVWAVLSTAVLGYGLGRVESDQQSLALVRLQAETVTECLGAVNAMVNLPRIRYASR